MDLVDPILAERGLELVDLEFRREAQGQILRLLVDREDGVDLDTLSKLSREVSDHLDVSESIEGSYSLEVSSPGINRPLCKPEHFVRYLEKKVRVRTIEPIGDQRNFLGVLKTVTAGAVSVDCAEAGEVTIPFSNIEKANYEHEFSAADFGRGPSRKAGSPGGRSRQAAK